MTPEAKASTPRPEAPAIGDKIFKAKDTRAKANAPGAGGLGAKASVGYDLDIFLGVQGVSE